MTFPRVASFKSPAAFRTYLDANGIPLRFDDELAPPADSPLAQPLDADGVHVGNRFCILPMEGWDGTREGEPGDLTRRRWRRFGESGAKLIWGGEAVAVRQDGRANPQQLLLTTRTQAALASLRDDLVNAHRSSFGANADRDLLVGLQLTHSGRFSRPDVWDQPAPRAACAHPILDRRVARGVPIFEDAELDRLADDFASAASLAADAGFQFVDFKHCHGYLAHELLGARTRAGRYGGPLTQRLSFLRRVVEAIRASAPGLMIGVRLSVFDLVPHHRDAQGTGVPDRSVPEAALPGFAMVHGDDLPKALAESIEVLRTLAALGVRWICVTAGSPYYCPHVQRPASFPPLDGYLPPEDPLAGVARQIYATSVLKAACPDMTFVGSAYSYLQEWLPHVAQHAVREGLTDFVGLGRLALSYPTLPSDVLAGRTLQRAHICRTFSDCTTGPRLGFVSGCFPLDPLYKARPEFRTLLDARTHPAPGT